MDGIQRRFNGGYLQWCTLNDGRVREHDIWGVTGVVDRTDE